MQNKITPMLWFEKDLDQVLEYYLSIFKENAKVLKLGDKQDLGQGEFQVGTIEIFGNKLDMLSAGPMFKFTEAISFTILCEDQEEVDYYWTAITNNGERESVCGWCKDKYGLSWQVVPIRFYELIESTNIEIKTYAYGQMMKMQKIIIKDLEK